MTLKVQYDGKECTLDWNDNVKQFTLDFDYEIYERLGDYHMIGQIENQTWVLPEHLDMLVDLGVVATTGTKGTSVNGNDVVLCNIIHPDYHDGGYAMFGDVARKQIGQQSQYASRYIDGTLEGYPALGEGLRFKGDPKSYHSVRIHRDDIPEFVRRYREHTGKTGWQ